MFSNNTETVKVAYNTNNYNVSLNLNFGEGKDSEICKNEKERKRFYENYNVEVFESGEGENYMKGYRVITN